MTRRALFAASFGFGVNHVVSHFSSGGLMNRDSISFEPLEVRQFLSASVGRLQQSASSAAGASDVVMPLAAATPTPTNGGVTLTEYATQQFKAKLGEFT